MLAVQQAAEGLVMQRFEMQQMPAQQMPPGSPTTPPMAPVEQIMPLQQPVDRPFVCPEPNCDKAYPSAAGLYQHKRSMHPWLINRREPYDYGDDDRRFACQAPGCDKAYSTSMGIYQHKRAKHPWLINQRARGYTRPGYNRKS